jgi:hypothetical protein
VLKRSIIVDRRTLRVRRLQQSAPRVGYKCHPSARGDLAEVPSCDTPIVVMEPTEHGDCVDTSVCLD